MTGERIIISKISDVPEEVLCTFARKVARGVHYFVGYRRGEYIHVHFSMKKHDIKEIVSYQHVLSPASRVVKKKK